MKKVLVATDLSDRSEIAVRRAASIARKSAAKLHVIHVVDGEWPLTFGQTLKERAETFIEAQLAGIEDAKRVETEVSSIFGDPSSDIASMALDVGADLIVMGRHRNRGIADFFRGTTIERMARTATVSILVATRAPDVPYARAVIGVDFSACATNAAALAADLVGEANLLLVHAYHIPFKNLTMRTDRRGGISVPDQERIQSDIRLEIGSWLKSTSLKLDMHDAMLREGSAVDVLPRVASDMGSDLICLGAHSRSWLSSAILGSTARELLSYSDLDILIVPL